MTKTLDKKILETINRKKTVTITELCEEFDFSESSCRRALRRLEAQELISRFHGGANCLEKNQSHLDIYKRFNYNSDSKELIAQEAAKKIKPNSRIILLGGTTVFRICKYIKNMTLTVITNSIIVFNELSNCHNIELILLGGILNREEAELRGFLTVSNSKLFTCDHVFMGTEGYIKNAGLTTTDDESIELYHWCMALSQETNVLTDSSKFKKRSKAIVVSLNQITSLITDEGISKEIVDELSKNNINVQITKKE
ncbi:MAG: DeoR/GlpR transcriptional regulator [Bacillales bacterium]|jgi:DeoR/GlpR family transcriptional regulator of sugar metabolism|nr:DeoR/GlpR transcriptional regulator [Bacillales bacterium]